MAGVLEIDPNYLNDIETHVDGARKDLRAWLRRVRLPYFSPHQFWHGHVQSGYLNSEKPAQRKAVCENVMHKSEMITDAIYSSFKEGELKNQVASLGSNGENEGILSDGDIEKIANVIIAKLNAKT